jgi:hypothetical protein
MLGKGATHRIARIFDLFALSNETSKNISALFFCLECDALALLQAPGTILEYGSAS